MKGRELLIGVTGGIAAYKTAELVSRCVQAGAAVTVVMTEAAGRFVGKTTFEALTGRPVYTKLFEPQEHYIGEHIALAQRAELYCIAPATANIIGKIANGLADDLVSTLAISLTGPLLLVPAMNQEMWNKPALKRNVALVRSDGVEVLEPAEGWLSCRQVGPGRMPEPEAILEAIAARLPS